MKKRQHSRHHGSVPSQLVMVTVGVFCGFFLGLRTRNLIVPCDTGDLLSQAGHELPGTYHSVDFKETPTSASQLTGGKEDASSDGSSGKPPKQLVLVGVMTAQKYLNSRVIAAYNTWVNTIPGKVVFFSSAGSESLSPPGIRVISLPGVDDTYPPQKKSFMMLKYMHDHYLGQFEYFMRADDDVYIRGDRLADFLHSLNASKTLFIGQAGQGNKEDIGRLNLQGEENFCMGGPSMVLSHSTMANMVPHISFCLKNLYTAHEDVEIGRCVHMFAGVFCTWAFEMQHLFLNNYKEPNGSFCKSLKTKEVHQAITLHPVKNHTYQYRLHHHFHMQRAAALRQDVLNLHREVHTVNELLQDRDAFYSPNRLGLPPSLLKTVPKSHDEVIPWDFITTYKFSLKSANPRHGLELSLRKGLEDVVMQTMEMINKNARQRGRTIDFQKILYGYHRVNPLHGADYVLDLLLVYRKHKGKRRMTVPVRRHAYLQQTFTQIEFMEVEGPTASDATPTTQAISQTQPKQALFDILQQRLGQFYGAKNEKMSETLPTRTAVPTKSPTIHFILPLSGRFQTFLQFMNNFEEVFLQERAPVVLAVMLFRSELEDRTEGTIDFVRSLQRKYKHHDLRVVQVEGAFSRALGLTEGSKLFSNDTLLFFVDVDIYMRQDVLYRIVHNVQLYQQVYYPIVFSQYDPTMTCREDKECTEQNSPFVFSSNKGYWRQFGYGIAAMYKSELLAVGGFDTSIQGWGKEDVDLYTRFLAKNMTVFRAADPGLVHIFHPVTCDPGLDSAQYQMCLGSKAATYGSTARLADFVYKTPEILYKNEQDPEQEGDQEDEAPQEANNDGGNDPAVHLDQGDLNLLNLEQR